MKASWRRWQGNLKQREDSDQQREKVETILAEGSTWSLQVGTLQAHSCIPQVCTEHLLCVMSCARCWGYWVNKPDLASPSCVAIIQRGQDYDAGAPKGARPSLRWEEYGLTLQRRREHQTRTRKMRSTLPGKEMIEKHFR